MTAVAAHPLKAEKHSRHPDYFVVRTTAARYIPRNFPVNFQGTVQLIAETGSVEIGQ
jgi:hypothetical protein